ncbi:MAG: prolyl oligopeptidase family serine peptidase, partial [Planctomycetaceae bacterium]
MLPHITIWGTSLRSDESSGRGGMNMGNVGRPIARMLRILLVVAICFLSRTDGWADGATDNDTAHVRPIPPPGIEVSGDAKARLADGVATLRAEIEKLRDIHRQDERLLSLLPDVEIFARAVDQAIRFNEMFAVEDIQRAASLLEEGAARAGQLAAGDAPWTRQKGLVVRGFRSRLDDTVQPYGLVIPDSYTSETPGRYRCDVWLHGRGEKSVELQFIHTRMTNPGEYQPPDTIVLHPFGRYSNAFKFAGEVDVLEALEHAKSQYRIDDDRISIRGFSMGGAGCWQFAVHYTDRWFAANPGAGFSETPQFLLSFQGEQLSPTWWEKTLWQWYDCPAWVTNLANCPTIAYSGELDIQKQAADVMEQAFRGLSTERADTGFLVEPTELMHVIGSKMGHRIDVDSKTLIEARMASIASHQTEDIRRYLRFTSPTLRYNQMHWIEVNGMSEHWRPMSVSAEVGGGDSSGRDISIFYDGVEDMTLHFPAGAANWKTTSLVVTYSRNSDFNTYFAEDDLPPISSDHSWTCRLWYNRRHHKWQVGTPPWEGELRKRHGLTGPIDDAFMDSFLFVKPSGVCRHPAVEEWT